MVGSNPADPFPLFHLASLDFDCNSSTVSNLPTYQLALSPCPSDADPRSDLPGDDSLESLVKRTFRRRREKVRAQIASKAPMSIFASPEDRAKEEFSKFELIDLSFDLAAGLEDLTSAQLAAVVFHPNATKDLVMDAEDIFFPAVAPPAAVSSAAAPSVATPAVAPPPTQPAPSTPATQPTPAPPAVPTPSQPASRPTVPAGLPARPPPPSAPREPADPAAFQDSHSIMLFSMPGMRPPTASTSRLPSTVASSSRPEEPHVDSEKRITLAEYKEGQPRSGQG
ncbi:hypothetical protein JCM10212_001919 [Sporobolomyces blumeae]